MRTAAPPIPLLLSGPHPRVGGGVVAHCGALQGALAALGLKVQQVHVGAGLDGDETLRARLRGAGHLLGSLPGFARRSRGRLVHLNPSFTPKAALRDAALMLAARLQGAPVVVEFHGGLPGNVRGPLGQFAVRQLCRADAVVVINRLQERALLGRFPWVRDRLHRVPNGVQLPPLDLDGLIPRRQEGRELLFMSRLLEAKGLLDTVRAMPALPGLTLNVAGTGPAAEPARALAAELGVASRVVFHGHVSGEAKSELLRRCALMVFPSYYPEGQPIVLLEALAWGLPVVTCAVEPITDLITTECGRLIPPRSPGALALATQELLASPARYGVISRHNRTLAEFEYDLNLVARRFAQLYRQVQWSRP